MNEGRHYRRANSGSRDLSDLDTFTRIGAKLGSAYVSIVSRGVIILSSGFCRKARGQLEDCDYVILSYSRNSHAIVMQFTDDPDAPGTIKMTKRDKNVSFGARTFFHYYELSPDDVKARYEPELVKLERKGNCWLLDLNRKLGKLAT